MTVPLQGIVEEIDAPYERPHDAHTHPWWKVMCLTGVDYFSTLGYQPGIAALAAGALAPLATLVLVLITLFGALPMYARVARESPHGDGSISMLERLLPWWQGKLFVLALLGFVATGFVITITLSAADASAHLIENPYTPFLHGLEVPLTLALIALLGAVFLKGFSEAIGIAVGIVAVYLTLNVVVIGTGLSAIVQEPQLLMNWRNILTQSYSSPVLLVGAALLLFPKLALGLSGFETGVVVMPLIKGEPGDTEAAPEGRIRNARKLLAAAALIMSVLLSTSSVVTTVLIPPDAFLPGGPANGRALAYFAHEHLGNLFGTIYDLSTILILWFAGASAMAGLLNIVPRYLPRYGMAPDWARDAPAGPPLHRHLLRRHDHLQGQRGRASRRLCDRGAGADDLGDDRGDPLGDPPTLARGEHRLRGRGGDLRLHHGGRAARAAGRLEDCGGLHRRDHRHLARVPGLAHDRAAGDRDRGGRDGAPLHRAGGVRRADPHHRQPPGRARRARGYCQDKSCGAEGGCVEAR